MASPTLCITDILMPFLFLPGSDWHRSDPVWCRISGHEQKGLPGAVGGVLRQIPPTVVRPLIVASEATSNLLGGMRNQIKPDARKEDFLKWRTEDGQEWDCQALMKSDFC